MACVWQMHAHSVNDASGPVTRANNFQSPRNIFDNCIEWTKVHVNSNINNEHTYIPSTEIPELQLHPSPRAPLQLCEEKGLYS